MPKTLCISLLSGAHDVEFSAADDFEKELNEMLASVKTGLDSDLPSPSRSAQPAQGKDNKGTNHESWDHIFSRLSPLLFTMTKQMKSLEICYLFSVIIPLFQ